MVNFGPWVWSEQYQRHFKWSYDDNGNPIECHWSGAAGSAGDTSSHQTTTVDETKPRTSYTLGSIQPPANQSSSVEPPGGNYTTSNPESRPYSHYNNYSQTPSTLAYGQTETGEATTPSTQSYGAWNAQPPSAYHTSYNNQNPGGYSYSQQPHQYQHQYAGTQYGSASQTNSYSYGQQNSLYAQSLVSEQPSHAVSLPIDVQRSVGGDRSRRYIKTDPASRDESEKLDPKYRRVALPSHAAFFVPGRVFKMLWIEPAGMVAPGKTRGSTHFSVTEVRFGELAYSEIRRFVVIRNCGTYSQCVPVQTYRGQGATKAGLNVQAHGVIHTSYRPPNLLAGENITKQALRVISKNGEMLDDASRINYAKPYAVEHNVKVLEIGEVAEEHIHLLQGYFENAVLYGS